MTEKIVELIRLSIDARTGALYIDSDHQRRRWFAFPARRDAMRLAALRAVGALADAACDGRSKGAAAKDGRHWRATAPLRGGPPLARIRRG